MLNPTWQPMRANQGGTRKTQQQSRADRGKTAAGLAESRAAQSHKSGITTKVVSKEYKKVQKKSKKKPCQRKNAIYNI